jgi:hypothetical protein
LSLAQLHQFDVQLRRLDVRNAQEFASAIERAAIRWR